MQSPLVTTAVLDVMFSAPVQLFCPVYSCSLGINREEATHLETCSLTANLTAAICQ